MVAKFAPLRSKIPTDGAAPFISDWKMMATSWPSGAQSAQTTPALPRTVTPEAGVGAGVRLGTRETVGVRVGDAAVMLAAGVAVWRPGATGPGRF